MAEESVKHKSISEHLAQNCEQTYRTLFERTTNPIFIIDSYGHYLDCNEAASRFLESPKQEILTKTVYDFAVHNDTFDERLAKHKQLWKEGGTVEIVYLVENQPRVLEMTITPIQLRGETVIFGVGKDVTERNRALEDLERTRRLQDEQKRLSDIALKKSEERYRSIFLSANDAFFIHDGSGNIIDANPKALEMIGYTEEELKNENYYNFLDEEKRDNCKKRLLTLKVKGEMETETRFKQKNGNLLDVHVQCRLIDAEEDIFQSVVRNMTEHRRSENEKLAFQRLNHRLTGCQSIKEIGKALAEETYKLFNYDAFSLFHIDRRKKLVYAVYNEDTPDGASAPEEMEVLPQRPFTTVDKDYNVPVLINRPEKPSLDNQMTFGISTKLSRSLMFAPIMWRDQCIARITLQSYTPDKYTHRDFNLLQTFAEQSNAAFARILAEEERKKLEVQVQHTQKLESLGILAGGIAHDFNNLLTGILGNAALALKEMDPASSIWDSVFQVKKAAQKASELTRQMLAYSGKGKLITQTLNISVLVEEMAHLLTVSISKNAVLKYDFNHDLPVIVGDAAQIQQVIMNLITNASEAIGTGCGKITIRTGIQQCTVDYLADAYAGKEAPEGEYVFVEVSDDGSGMDKDVLNKIFDPFFTTKFTGRGLGLAAALGIVRSHNGALKVYSEVNKGTTFRVLFPASHVLESQIRLAPVASEWKGKGTVLIVDDDEIVLKIAERIIQSTDLKVLKARNGKEALDQFVKHAGNISAVLLDMTMPVMGGEETFRALRKIDPNIKVILSSGYNEQEATAKFNGLGLDGFAQKPYEPSYLIEKLKSILCN